MDGIDQLDIGTGSDRRQRLADALESGAEAFAAMGGDQDELLRWIEPRPAGALQPAVFETVAHGEDRVDAGVAGDGDGGGGHAFTAKILRGAFGGGEMQRGQRRR